MTLAPTPQSAPLAQPAEISVIVVKRNDSRVRVGQGMLRGMQRVVEHFGKSLVKTSTSKRDIDGMFTIEYPEERLLLPEAARQLPILLYDDASGHELCTGCLQCERVCPPQVIHITPSKDPATGKPVPAADEFVIEYDTCMSCGYCAEVCPFDAIKMDHVYELATPDHLTMDVHKAHLDRPTSYYDTIAPTMWAAVRDGALKKLQNNIKKRPGTVGVTPALVGRVAQATAGAAPAAGRTAASSGPAAPLPPPGKNMSPEKLAKLMAIRAAKQGGVSAEAAPAPSGYGGRRATSRRHRSPSGAKRGARGRWQSDVTREASPP